MIVASGDGMNDRDDGRMETGSRTASTSSYIFFPVITCRGDDAKGAINKEWG